MSNGGCDVVIGNPPYGGTLTETETDYFYSHFKSQDYQLDTYLLFIEQALALGRLGGFVGYIIPNTWLLNLQSPKIRRQIFNGVQIENIVHYRHRVFPKVTVDTEVAIFK